MGSVTLKPTDPEAAQYEALRRANEEQTRAHREGRDSKPQPEKPRADVGTEE